MKENLISINDLTRDDIESFLSKASQAEKISKRKAAEVLPGHVLSTIFLEPSTRTRLSFETAMMRLGGSTINLTEEVSSIEKGENITDTGIVVAGYTDICVIRSPYEGTARMLAEKTGVPVINGGDGANQHPTQTLLDLYTIKKEFGRIDGLKVGMMGDLKYGRTVHSLAEALDNYDVDIRLISPEETKMPRNIVREVGVEEETTEMRIKDLDVLYATRIQKERFPDKQEYERVKDAFILDKERVEEMKDNSTLMHPLPRVGEIKPGVDELPQAHYFEQAKNGVPTRMGIILELLGVDIDA
ncbi:MAG: aspartate carbamoyltransferase [Candidatus Aenigmatarchaeota archaeon]